eukprot:COSAG02_NODE_5006_length_4726_cov_21.452021_1_plen_70_part_10
MGENARLPQEQRCEHQRVLCSVQDSSQMCCLDALRDNVQCVCLDGCSVEAEPGQLRQWWGTAAGTFASAS